MKKAKRLFAVATVFMIALAAAIYYVYRRDISSTKMQLLFAAVISLLAVITYLSFYFSSAAAKESRLPGRPQTLDEFIIRTLFKLFAVALILLLVYIVLFVLNLIFPWLVPDFLNANLSLERIPQFVKLFIVIFGAVGALQVLATLYLLFTSFSGTPKKKTETKEA
ncbi:MAG: hypothetical protein IIZ52_02110 [Erysipelotrichaceae bacterium]|nr:hypothetical protein [Erysipelotrichaceae bacterium]MBQ1512270.1 hypothetical protein [Erysipelotrichaceae bacterium]